jgi:hypothetical protein
MDAQSRQEVPILKPNTLFQERASRDKARLRAYNQLLEQIYTRIRTAARVPGNNWILYTVPPFVFGLPKIDMEDCIVYLVFQMRQVGYEVRFTYPNLLYISWKHHERNYILQESPIMKAMLPPAPPPNNPTKSLATARTQPSAKPGLRFVQDSMALTAPTRSAGEYAPPNSFINAMSGGLGENPARPKPAVLNDLFQF